jgi:GAF domain-containing protein
VIWEGIERQELAEIRPGEGPTGTTFQTGVASIRDDIDTSGGCLAEPVANIPLRLNGQVIGVFALFATFEQKTRFIPVDFEFFQLLSSQAAAAVIAARLFVQADGNAPSLEAFFDLGV